MTDDNNPGEPFLDMRNIHDKLGVYFFVLTVAGFLITWPLFLLGMDGKIAALIAVAAGLIFGRALVKRLAVSQGHAATETP